ncbi:MAG: GNAT family N-acetyltransferase [Methylococcales bacterium]
MTNNNLCIRLATLSDADAINALIEASAKALGTTDYTAEQIELALVSAWGLDTQLIKDNSYYVVETEQHPSIVACGGWSYRQTLFGNDAEQNRDPKTIDVETGAAKIRAFFVHGSYSRQGIGTMILNTCEAAAMNAGYKKLELMATLPGLKLYQKFGYLPQETVHYPLNHKLTIEFVAMTKTP